jgi:uncharacterized protein (TIGR02996 family)
MNDEAALLAAVEAAPHDAGLRLVYADWLDERGDPRGELIRIEEEMGRLPVFIDRFWELKPRRNELRAATAPEWLAAMRYGTDYQPVFGHGVPDDWKGRWRLIREFVERWHRIPIPDVGGRADEIRDAEERLRVTLPPSVREWIALGHDVRERPEAAQLHSVYEHLNHMWNMEDDSAVSVLWRSSGDYEWAVLYDNLVNPDPPLTGFWFEDSDSPEGLNPSWGTVTDTALNYVIACTDWMYGGFRTDVEDVADLIGRLTATFPIRCSLRWADIFETENILVRLTPNTDTSGRIEVKIARATPRGAIPGFLEQYRNQGMIRTNQFAVDPYPDRSCNFTFISDLTRDPRCSLDRL